MPLAMNQSQRLSKLDGVYGLRQPGCSPHPVLKHRQRQRNDLRRSASMVLAANHNHNRSAAPMLSDVDRPLELDEWSTDFAKTGSLLPLKEVNYSSWVQPNFVHDVPPRLEDCRLRLEAVERELNRYTKAVGGSGFRAVKQHHELPAFVQDFQGYQEGLFAFSHQSHAAAAAPAPGKVPAAPPRESQVPETPEMQLEDEYAEQLEAEEDDRIPEHLSTIETELLQLDTKWQMIEGERETTRHQRDEIESLLAASKAHEKQLMAKVSSLGTAVQEAEAEKEHLRLSLGVSEARAEDLRQRLRSLRVQEETLQTQAAGLVLRLETLDGERSALQSRLNAVERESSDEFEGGLTAQVDLSTDLELVESELRSRLAAKLATERAGMQRRQSNLEESLAEATERCRLAEEERERLASLDSPSPVQREASVSTPPSPEHGLALPSFAAVPELVLLSGLSTWEDDSENLNIQPKGIPAQPARCHLDLLRHELCLQPLAPRGEACALPLADIIATRPDSPLGNIVELNVLKGADGPLLLATSDAHAASELVAALGLPDRVPPGFMAE